MWKFLVKIIPFDKLVLLVAEILTGLSDEIVKDLWSKLLELVEQAEAKYGSRKGMDKFLYVKKKLEEIYPNLRGWAINFLIELAVGYLKNEGVIK